MKVISVNPEKCVGCRLCELACSLKHTREFNPMRARIQVVGFEELFSFPLTCFQCEKPFCVDVCPTRAISRNQATGVVKVSKIRCIGCRMCTVACPFGNIGFSIIERTAVKCELCNGEPECVLFCPTMALEWKEIDSVVVDKKRSLLERLKGGYEGMRQS